MGCPCELRFHAGTAARFARAVRRCVREVRRFDRKYSRYRADSVVSAINRAAGRAAVAIDRETAALLRYAGVCHEQSAGAFDITTGVFRHVWHPGRTTLPGAAELQAGLARVGWHKVELSADRVYLPVPGMELDFGGVVKEYAADAAAVVARQAGIRHGLINLGGDIRVVGPQPDGTPWPIGVVHPLQTGRAIASLSLPEGAMATSGGYERYLEIDGRRYGHLIDPRTGWPVQGLLSVSVIAGQAVVAGSIASAALLQPVAAALRWLERSGAPYLAVDPGLALHGHLRPQAP